MRSTAFGLTYSLSVSAFGGTTQFALASLGKLTGSALVPAWYMLVFALVGLVGHGDAARNRTGFSARA